MNNTTFYKGIQVKLDDDFDTRLLDVIDNLPSRDKKELISASESEGCAEFLWKRDKHSDYPSLRDLNTLIVFSDWMDSWTISHKYLSNGVQK